MSLYFQTFPDIFSASEISLGLSERAEALCMQGSNFDIQVSDVLITYLTILTLKMYKEKHVPHTSSKSVLKVKIFLQLKVTIISK